MRAAHASYLSDPVSHHALTLTTFSEADDHIISGILKGEESWYPIIFGIPRMMIGELRLNLLQEHFTFFEEWKEKLPKEAREEWQAAIDAIPDFDRFVAHQKKTGESFAYEWKTIYRENSFEKSNFLHFLSPYVAEKDLEGKLMVDIGCGSGRFTKQAALCGGKVVFGTDLGESVGVAYEMTKSQENVCIVQADIYAMPFAGVFDLAFSIGVLHHLPQPEQGFASLPKVLKKGGKMLIWVYNRRNNGRALYFYEPLRSLARPIPRPLLLKLCYLPAVGVHAINGLTHLSNAVGAKKIGKRIPFSYYANFPFNMKLNDAFDVLATPKSNYYLVEQIEDWFAHAKLADIEAYEHPEAGITCVGTHASAS